MGRPDIGFVMKRALAMLGAACIAQPALAQAQETPTIAIERALDLVGQGRDAEAMQSARAAAELCEAPQAEARECYMALGMAAELAGQLFDTAVAAQWAGASVAAAEEFAGRESIAAAIASSDYATRLGASYRFNEAAEAASRAVSILEQQRGRGHPETDNARNAFADLLYDQGRIDEAEAHYRIVLENARQRSGQSAIETGLALNRLARVYFVQERYSEAIELFLQSMEAQAGTEGFQSIGYHIAQLNLGLSYLKLGDAASAEPLIRAAVESGQLQIDLQSLFAGNNALSRVWLADRRFDQAYRLASTNLAESRQRMGERYVDVGRYTVMLGRIAAARGDVDEALALFEQGTAILHETIGDHTPTRSTRCTNRRKCSRAWRARQARPVRCIGRRRRP